MAAVKRYEILDTPADGSFDRVTAIAARRFGVPISIISIVDHDRIWFKSHHGLEGVKQIDREPGLCASAILRPDPHILPDATKDIRSLANPLVAGDFGLRFYAGVPLQTSDGFNLGTLCVIDKEPRPITEDQIEDLKDLASLVMDQLEFRLSALRALAKADKSLAQANLLAREIDHRVMNSLQFVTAMLRLQGKKASERKPPPRLRLPPIASPQSRVFTVIFTSKTIPPTSPRLPICADCATIFPAFSASRSRWMARTACCRQRQSNLSASS